MTYPLQPGSEHAAPARRFGRALGRSMADRGISERQLAMASGIGRSHIRQIRAGHNLPALATGRALAAALDDEALADLIRRCRTVKCAICPREFVNEGTPQRYCSDLCRAVATKKRVGVDTRVRADRAERDAAETLSTLTLFREAVTGMCLGCEPEGVCRTSDCALRAVSPLPMLGHERVVTVARQAPGPYGTEENRRRTVEAIREALRKRWAAPGAREEQGRLTRDWHARLTAEARAELGRKIAAGRAGPT